MALRCEALAHPKDRLVRAEFTVVPGPVRDVFVESGRPGSPRQETVVAGFFAHDVLVARNSENVYVCCFPRC